MKPEELAIAEGYESGLTGRGPFAWYMRWYLRKRRPVEAEDVLAALGGGPYPRVLDAGCGTGLWLEDLCSRGHGTSTLAGIDVSALMIEDTRHRLEHCDEDGIDVDLHVGSATTLPYDDDAFDLVMANGMVKHLDDDDFAEFLAEASRVLAPGGRISVWDFGRPLLPLPQTKPRNAALELKNLRTSEVLIDWLKGAGFEECAPYTLKRPWRLPVTLEGAVGTRAVAPAA